MGKLLKVLLATAMTFSLVTVTHAEETETPKVEVIVESGNVTVSGKVMPDYSIVATIPTVGQVNPQDVDVTISMSNIASLGITDRTHTWNDLSFNVGNGTVDFGFFIGENLPEGYETTIKGSVEGNSYKYDVIGNRGNSNNVYTITGTPTGVQAAYHEVASHIETSTQAADDSYAIIAKGSYLAVGSQILTIDSELTMDNLEAKNEIYQEILAAGTLHDNSISHEVEIYLAEGTTLAVGSSIATLKDAATITVDGVSLEAVLTNLGLTVENGKVLSCLRETVTDTTSLIATLVFSVVPVLEATANEEITVNVDFEEKVDFVEKGKFNIELTSGTATVVADVADDYTINLKINRSAKVDPKLAALTVYMRGVEGLGLGANEERSHTWTVEDLLSVGVQDLDGFVNALDDFEGATLKGSVGTETTTTTITKDENGNVIDTVVTTDNTDTEYKYIFEQAGTADFYGITGTQTGAQAAWAELVSHLTPSTSSEDSYAVIGAGSYLVVDGETLVIGEDGLKLDNLEDRKSNYDAILEASTWEKRDLGKTEAEVEIYLTAGTKLSVGSSVVTLDDNARVVLDGVSIRDMLGFTEEDTTVLAWARESIDSTSALIATLVFKFNPIVEQLNNEEVTLDVIFEVEETKDVVKETSKPGEDEKPEPKPEEKPEPKPEEKPSEEQKPEPKPEEKPSEEQKPEPEDKDDDLSTETGDNAPVVTYASLALISALALFVVVLKKRLSFNK